MRQVLYKSDLTGRQEPNGIEYCLYTSSVGTGGSLLIQVPRKIVRKLAR